MRAFSRFKHTISVGIESLLDQVENQQAVAAASIRDVERALARVRMQRKRCERQLSDLEQARQSAAEAAAQWMSRARELHGDRPKALECLRRHHTSDALRVRREQEIEAQRQLKAQLDADEQAVEARLVELRRRCMELSAREARGLAMAHDANDVDALFDRWEARLGDAATTMDRGASDAFEQHFARAEEQAALEAELDCLWSGPRGGQG